MGRSVDLEALGVQAADVSAADRQRIESLIDDTALRELAMQGMGLRSHERAQSLTYRYALGKIMHKAARLQGSDACIKTLGEAWQLDRDQAYHVFRFAKRYNKREFEQLLRTQLTWSHVRILVNVDSNTVRKQLQRRAVLEQLGYRDLSKAAQVELGSRSNNPSGREMAVPATIPKGLSKMRTVLRHFLRMHDTVFLPHILQKLNEIESDDHEAAAATATDLVVMLAQASAACDNARAVLCQEFDAAAAVYADVEETDENTEAELVTTRTSRRATTNTSGNLEHLRDRLAGKV